MHVNADDPVSCLSAARLAIAYRQRFGKDFLIDLVGYRRWGHNEGDEPAFTQPRMYATVSGHPPCASASPTSSVAEGDHHRRRSRGDAAGHPRAGWRPRASRWSTPAAARRHRRKRPARPRPSDRHRRAGGATARLRRARSTRCPRGAARAPKLLRQWERRAAMLDQPDGEGKIDWAHAETLALASILADGTPIRLTGQDSERGTFSQRHLVLHDVDDRRALVPLQTLARGQGVVRGLQQPALGGGGGRVRVRLHRPRAGGAGALGGAVRRLRQRRAGHHRSVPGGGARQMAAGAGAGAAPAARLRGAGTGALVGAAGALPAALRRGQSAGRQPDDRGAVFPPAAAPGEIAGRRPAAAGGDDAQEPAAQPAGGIDARPARERFIPAGARRSAPGRGACRRHAAGPLLRQARGRAGQRARSATRPTTWRWPARAAGAIPGRRRSAACWRATRTLEEIVWAQEEPRNMGAWAYVEPRLRELLAAMRASAADRAMPAAPSALRRPRARSTGTRSSRRASSRPRWRMPRRVSAPTAAAGDRRRRRSMARRATAPGRKRLARARGSDSESRPAATRVRDAKRSTRHGGRDSGSTSRGVAGRCGGRRLVEAGRRRGQPGRESGRARNRQGQSRRHRRRRRRARPHRAARGRGRHRRRSARAGRRQQRRIRPGAPAAAATPPPPRATASPAASRRSRPRRLPHLATPGAAMPSAARLAEDDGDGAGERPRRAGGAPPGRRASHRSHHRHRHRTRRPRDARGCPHRRRPAGRAGGADGARERHATRPARRRPPRRLRTAADPPRHRLAGALPRRGGLGGRPGRAQALLPPPPDDRQPAGRGAADGRHADDLQRGGHERGDGAAGAAQGSLQGALRGQPRLHVLLHQGRRRGAEGRSRR